MAPALPQLDNQKLATYFPLGYFTDEERQLFLSSIKLATANKGEVLISGGSKDPRAIYLLQGKLELCDIDGRRNIVEAEQPSAKRPISHLVPHRYKVTAQSMVVFFWMEVQIIHNLISRHKHGDEEAVDLHIQARNIANPVFQSIFADVEAGRMELPVLPTIAAHYKEIISEDADIRRIKQLLQTDPALSASLMKVANSALYRGSKQITTLEQAIVRIGMKTLNHYVIAFVVRKQFKTRSAFIKQQMQRLWHHTIEVAAVSYEIARLSGRFDPDHALLLGLMHDVGALAVLHHAEKFIDVSQNEQELSEAIRWLHGDVGGVMMAKWNFPEDCVRTARESDDWYRDPAPEADVIDIVLVAQLLSFMGKRLGKDTPPVDFEKVPTLTEVPACRKLGIADLSPEQMMNLMKSARQGMAEALKQVS